MCQEKDKKHFGAILLLLLGNQFWKTMRMEEQEKDTLEGVILIARNAGNAGTLSISMKIICL